MTEVFIPIKDFENAYQISNFGRVKSLSKNIIRKPYLDKDGYQCVTLKLNGKAYPKKIHRLVALNFFGENQGLVVNHKNGIKTDNRLDNLELITILENNLHCIKTNLRKQQLVKSLVTNEVLTINEWSDKLKVSTSMIYLMKNNLRKNNLKLQVYDK